MAGRWREAADRLGRLAARHQAAFWTLHSAWALGWGVAFMLAGSRRTWLLRYGLAAIGLVWATSLALPAFLRGPWIPGAHTEKARKLVLWGQKWVLQGLAFFILPLYHRSATYPSRNTLFMGLLVCAALGVTIDVVYDEYVTRRRALLGAFLAFTAFACVNLTLPVLWHVGGLWNLAASAVLATAVFASFRVRPRADGSAVAGWRSVAVSLLILAAALLGRRLVPPAPLRLVATTFGTALGPTGLEVSPVLQALPAAAELRLHVVAAVQAPAGLAEGVRHVWSVDGARVYESRLIGVTGGRAEGFRSRSTATLRGLVPGRRLRVEVETAWGQLIGRSEIPVR